MSPSSSESHDEKVYILSYRDECTPEPRQLVAFTDEVEGRRVRDRLASTLIELMDSGKPSGFVNLLWTDELRRCRIPEEKHFEIDPERHSNRVFELRGIDLQK